MKQTRLKLLDRYLTVWILLAMFAGIAIGYVFPQTVMEMNQRFSGSGTTNWLLAAGLLLMMYPPFVKVNYAELPRVFMDGKVLLFAMLMNWVVAPLLMFALAYLMVPDSPEYFTGLILIGIAPCIAMVVVWNELAEGSREYVTGLVALNSILQILLYSVYAWFLLEVLPSALGLQQMPVAVSMSEIAKTVGIYLGIPFATGAISRYLLMALKGETWLKTKFIPMISPVTLIALLFTIVLMFSLKGEMMVEIPMDVARIALPLVVFFLIMFFLVFYLGRKLKLDYARNVTLSLTGSSNNFELAIAVAIGVFGLESGQAFAGVIGPLVEVPVLLALVRVALQLKKRYYA